MRNFLSSGNDSDLVEGPNLGAQSTVYAENFAVDNGSEDHKIKDLTACFPNRGVVVFIHTFFVKAIDLGDLARLMVASYKCDFVRVPKNYSDI